MSYNLSPETKKKMMSKIFWDTNIDTDRLYSFLSGEIDSMPLLDKPTIFRRLLSSFDWYTLLKLLPENMLKEALSPHVLSKLYPKDLRIKYLYARGILFK